VGLEGTGKTTMLYRLVLDEAVETQPNLGSNVEEIMFHNMKFVMWDIAGQQGLRPAWVNYYTDTAVVIFVIDSTDRDRLPISKSEMDKMLQHERLKSSKLLVLANKNDLKGAMTASELSQFMGLDTMRDRDWHIRSCCALTGEGLEDGLEWIASRV